MWPGTSIAARLSSPLALHLLIASVAFILAYLSGWAGARRLKAGALPPEQWLPIAAGLLPAVALMSLADRWSLIAWPLAGSLALLFAWGRLLALMKLRGRWMLPALLVSCVMLAVEGARLETVKLPLSATFVALGSGAVVASAGWLFLVAGLTTYGAGARDTANGITLITASAFLVISFLQPQSGQPAVSYLCVGLAATAAGFGLSGAPRFVVSLGPSARATLGLCLGVVSLVGALKTSAFLVLGIPLLLFGVPLLDATFPLFAPSLRRGSGERPGYPRLYQFLVAQGMTPSQIFVLFMLAAVYLALLAILLVALIRAHFLVKALVVALFLPAGFLALYGVYKLAAPVARRADESLPDEVKLFQVPVACLTEAEVLAKVRGYVASASPHHIVTCDAVSLVRATEDPDYLEMLQQADLVTADGAGVVWAARMLGLGLPARVSGVDLVDSISALAAQEGLKVYLLGAAPGVAAEAAQRLSARHPGLHVAGHHHGYFKPEEEPALVDDIRESGAHVLFVALGAPKQDRWIRRNLERAGAKVLMGVGGSLDVIAGRVPRSPEWMRRWGLEWLYRLLIQPRRWPRLLALPKLVVLTLGAFVRGGQDQPPAHPEKPGSER